MGEAKKHCQSRPTSQNQARQGREDAMKLEGGCYCGQVRYVAEGEPMMKAHATAANANISPAAPQHVCADAARRLQLQQGSAEAIYPQRSRERGDAGILRRMRHPSDHASAGSARGDFESRHARRSRLVWHPADGDLHHRQAGLSSNPRGLALLRAAAETVACAFVARA